jgi:predicted hotdog family 3-hydroxylacyl-ACP dehydratase
MVLLDAIERWDSEAIVCTSRSHLAPNNPLRDDGRLSVYAGVEYAAQAMAAHTRLLTDSSAPPRKGFLAVASKVAAQADALDEYAETLTIEARVIAQNRDSSMYQFHISAQGKPILEGQLTAVLSNST